LKKKVETPELAISKRGWAFSRLELGIKRWGQTDQQRCKKKRERGNGEGDQTRATIIAKQKREGAGNSSAGEGEKNSCGKKARGGQFQRKPRPSTAGLEASVPATAKGGV